MSTTIDLMQDVYASFTAAYAKEAAAGEVMIAFEPLGLSPGLDASAPGAAATALEYLSVNADLLPDLSSGNYEPTGRTLSTTYGVLLNGAEPSESTNVAVFNAMKSAALEMLQNGLVGSSLGAYRYFPAYASPANWYDVAQDSWSTYSFDEGQPVTTPAIAPAPATGGVVVRSMPMSIVNANAWRLTREASAEMATPVRVSSPAVVATNHPLAPPVNSFAMARRPQFVNRVVVPIHAPSEVSAQAPAVTISSNAAAAPSLQPEFKLTFQYCVVHLRRPWLSGDFLAADGWYVAGAKAGEYSAGVEKESGSVEPAPSGSGAPAETVASGSGTSAEIPVPVSADLPFSWIPTACIVIKQLEIKTGGRDTDPTIASTATALGPFSLSPSSSTGTSLSNPGIQIVAWICNAQPKLPAETDPALVPPPKPTTAEKIGDVAAAILGTPETTTPPSSTGQQIAGAAGTLLGGLIRGR